MLQKRKNKIKKRKKKKCLNSNISEKYVEKAKVNRERKELTRANWVLQGANKGFYRKL